MLSKLDKRLDKLKQEIADMRYQLNLLAENAASIVDPFVVHYSQLLDHKINVYYQLSSNCKPTENKKATMSA
jgi:uncharacterized membrane-anchored protein YhcB (DUF1043 family)